MTAAYCCSFKLTDTLETPLTLDVSTAGAAAAAAEIPEDLNQCLQAVGNLTVDNMAQQLACEAQYGQGNLHNCMIALDMKTGAVR
jgi:hypothetical protein